MSHHEDHAPGEAAHAHPAPGLPEIHDEAGDTPPWVPKVGIVVVAVLVGLLLYAFAPLQAAPSDAPAAGEPTETEKAEQPEK